MSLSQKSSCGAAGRRILIIDDNVAIHADFRKILAAHDTDLTKLKRAAAGLLGKPVDAAPKQGFELRSTYQGQEGLAAVEESLKTEKPFDMAFVDMRMPPGWDGIQTIRHLWEVDPGLQIVICTAYSDYEFDQIVSSLGLSDQFVILKKPFDSVEVLQLANALAQKRTLLRHLQKHVGDLEDTIRKNRQLEETLRASEERYRLITENVADLIGIIDADGNLLYSSPSFERVLGVRCEDVDGLKPFERLHPDDAPRARGVIKGTIETRRARFIEFRARHSDGTWRVLESHVGPFPGRGGKVESILFVARDITERRQAEAKLKATQQELIEASRLAGKAEMATSVLHNIGNVLNSVTVSAGVISSQLLNSKTGSIAKVASLIREHSHDLADFLKHDGRGRQLVDFLGQLSEHLCREETAMLHEMQSIRKNVEHIEHIVRLQQNCARTSSATETLNVVEVVEDALRMNATTLQRHDITIEREFPSSPALIRADRHKLLQVLVNLIRNAQDACDAADVTKKRVRVRIASVHSMVEIAVSDNGAGIAAETLPKLFAHGFTTKKNGHGFGLHSAALAVREMGGNLEAASPGQGCGATFTIQLPLESSGPGTG